MVASASPMGSRPTLSTRNGTLALARACSLMTDLNSASLADFAAAGLDPAQAREVEFWRPYSSWDQLLMLVDVDDAVLDRLKRQGFEIAAPNDAALASPKPFKLSVAAQYA